MFENQTTYSREAIAAMVRVVSKKVQRRRHLFRQGLLLVLGGLLLATGGLMLSVFSLLDFSSRLICIAALIIGGVSFLEGLFFRWFMARNTWRGLTRMGDDMERHFIFGEEMFQGVQPGMETTYAYSSIKGAYETAGYFLLQMDTGHSIVLDQTCFLQGDADGFRAFLADKLGRPVEFVK